MAGKHRPVAASSLSSGSRLVNRYRRCLLYAAVSSSGSRSPALSFAMRDRLLPPVPCPRGTAPRFAVTKIYIECRSEKLQALAIWPKHCASARFKPL